MIPTEYRLEQVTARLTERLEGTRRSFSGDPEAAARSFRRIAEDLLADAIAEFREDGFTDRPDRHEAFLREEVLGTYLPRYTRLATAMTEKEDKGYGAGFLYGPVGRVIMLLVMVAVGALLLRLPGPWGIKMAPFVPMVIAMFVPDLLGWAVRRRYRADLVDVLTDMRTIQDRASDYVPTTSVERDAAEDPVGAARRAAAARASDKQPKDPQPL